MGDPFLNYFALFLLIFVVVVLFYGIVAIHDIPAKIAESRHHPHQDAIHAAGWVSLFTLHALWPFLWIWAMAYRPERGWGFPHQSTRADAEPAANASELEDLRRRVAECRTRRPGPLPNKRVEQAPGRQDQRPSLTTRLEHEYRSYPVTIGFDPWTSDQSHRRSVHVRTESGLRDGRILDETLHRALLRHGVDPRCALEQPRRRFDGPIFDGVISIGVMAPGGLE